MISPILKVNNLSCSFLTPKVSDVLEIAKIDKCYEQNRMHYWLLQLMGDQEAVAKMTMQERYAWLLLHMKQKNIRASVEIDDYLAKDLNNFSRDRVDLGTGVTVRHLWGIEAEALERGAQTPNDYLMGEMAITIGCEELPELDLFVADLAHVQRSIHHRIEKLLSMDIEHYNDLCQKFYDAQESLPKLVNPAITTEGGYALMKIEGGADDAPIRFCISDCITGFCSRLL